MIKSEDVIERLTTLGYDPGVGDMLTLEFAIRHTVQYILRFCNLKVIPTELYWVAVDMAAGELLKTKYATGVNTCEGIDFEAGNIKQITEGDVSVTYNSDSDDSVTSKYLELIESLCNRDSELESSVKESFENVNENIGLCNEAVADETERAEKAEEKLSDRIDDLSSNVSDEIGELELAVDENRDKLTVYSSYAYIDDDGFNTTGFRSWESGTQFNKGDVLILYINSIDTDENILVGNINVDGTDYNCTTFEGDDISVEEISVNSFVFLVYDGSGFNISKADGE